MYVIAVYASKDRLAEMTQQEGDNFLQRLRDRLSGVTGYNPSYIVAHFTADDGEFEEGAPAFNVEIRFPCEEHGWMTVQDALRIRNAMLDFLMRSFYINPGEKFGVLAVPLPGATYEFRTKA